MCKVIDVHVFGNKAESGGKVEKGRTERGSKEKRGDENDEESNPILDITPDANDVDDVQVNMYIDVCCVEIDRHLLGSSVACAMSCTQVTNRSPTSLHY